MAKSKQNLDDMWAEHLKEEQELRDYGDSLVKDLGFTAEGLEDFEAPQLNEDGSLAFADDHDNEEEEDDDLDLSYLKDQGKEDEDAE